MAARLTDKQKKKIIADYAMHPNYLAVGKMNGVSDMTVKRLVKDTADMSEMLRLAEEKKEQNSQDILSYMESQRDKVNEIIAIGLACLPEKLENARSATEITTALGTLIDKWANIGGNADDPLYALLDKWNDAAIKATENDSKPETT